MANLRFTQWLYSTHKKLVELDCTFTVAPADSAGYGVTGLSGGGIASVLMHTSATPVAQVNPGTGMIQVNLTDNYNYLYGFSWSAIPYLSGSPINVTTNLTTGTAYQIVTLGSTTLAGWQSIGLPVGTTPALGVVFMGLTGATTGTGRVQALQATGSGVQEMAVFGSRPNLMIKSYAGTVAGQGNGSYILLGCYAATNSSTTTRVLTAPITSTIINLQFWLSNSGITENGD